MAFDFPVLLNMAIFSMDLLHEYLTFKRSCANFPDTQLISKHTPHNND